MITIKDITIVREPQDGMYTMSPLTNHVSFSYQEERNGWVIVTGETTSCVTLDGALELLEEYLTELLCE